MSDFTAFVGLLARTGVGLPRGVLRDAARAFAAAIVHRAPPAELDGLRARAAEETWEALRLAIGTALERAVGDAPDPVAVEALALVLDERPDNPLALALADEAGRSLAAVMERNGERLAVLERRLSDGAAVEAELALVIGQMVVDLLDLDPEDYEDEIAGYVQAGETESARTELARSTGDVESRTWAREELREVADPGAPVASRAIAALASGPAPDDPAEDGVWVATMLALVEQAVELTVISDNGGGGGE